jgi:hypothetical protein
MLQIRERLTLQQCPKHLALVSRLLQRHQGLNLTVCHQPLDPLFCTSILKYNKMTRVLGSRVAWVHEEFQLDELCLIHIGTITFSIFFALEMKGMGGISQTNEGKPLTDLSNLLIAIFPKL